MAETRLLRIDTFTFHILHVALHLHQECTSVKLALRRGRRLEERGREKGERGLKLSIVHSILSADVCDVFFEVHSYRYVGAIKMSAGGAADKDAAKSCRFMV